MMKTRNYDFLVGKQIHNIVVTKIIKSGTADGKCEIFCNLCKSSKGVNLESVLYGHTKSCGCARYIKPTGLNNKKCKNLTGQKFGNLSVIEIDNTINRGRIFWKCRCDCGNIKNVQTRHLTGGKIVSCGCRHHLKGKENPTWKGYEEISGRLWERIKKYAKGRGLSVKITIQDAWEKFIQQNKKCALTGLNLTFDFGEEKGNASLDRIDSSKGYTKENIQWVDKNINWMKNNFNEKKFLTFCKMVVEYHNKQ